MFNNLLGFWKGKDFLSNVLEEFNQMLSDAQSIFSSVCRKLIYNEDVTGLEDTVYDVDKKINDLQKNIRKKIIQHLSLRPSVDISACLLLMSVVKDAERLGDYCKNLFEVIQFLQKPIDQKRYQDLFDRMDQDILELFEITKKAFIESDENTASTSWHYESRIAKRCDKIIRNLAKSNISVNEAVCFTLIARHFKRITAHLANTATSVILPLDELDYFDEKQKNSETD